VTVTPFLAQKIAEMADFAAFLHQLRKANDRQIQRRRRAEFFNKINVRPDTTNAGIDRTGRR
jgi:hypothetical protein